MNDRATNHQRRRQRMAGCLAIAFTAVGTFTCAGAADDALEEVVVSARKRAEKAHDVPISLSEVGGADRYFEDIPGAL